MTQKLPVKDGFDFNKLDSILNQIKSGNTRVYIRRHGGKIFGYYPPDKIQLHDELANVLSGMTAGAFADVPETNKDLETKFGFLGYFKKFLLDDHLVGELSCESAMSYAHRWGFTFVIDSGKLKMNLLQGDNTDKEKADMREKIPSWYGSWVKDNMSQMIEHVTKMTEKKEDKPSEGVPNEPK